MPDFVSDRRLYLTAPLDDPSAEVVEEGDERARTLLVGEGSELDAATADRFGLKARAPVEDKAAKPAEGKSAGDAAPTAEGDEAASSSPGSAPKAKKGG